MRTIFTFYSIAFFVFVWLFRKVESLNIGRKWKESVTIPLRLIILLITVLFDIVLYQNIQWIGTVWNVVRFYIYALGGFTAITIWTRARFIKEEKDKNKYSFLMYAACFLIPLFYVMLTTYSNSIYIILPTNRGGKLPVTRATISFASDKIPSRIKIKSNGSVTTRPVYIIEQNDECIYIIHKYPAFKNFEFPEVFMLRENDIDSITFKKFDVRRDNLK